MLKLALAAVLICLMFAAANGYSGKVGGRKEIEDVKNNKEVQELGRFSVAEYNRNQRQSGGGGNAGKLLQFVEVVEAQSQVVAGIKYYLKIATDRNGARVLYDSEVVVKAWLRSRELLSFQPHGPK